MCCDTKFDLDLAVGDRHIWPRLVAMAEVTWSKDNSDACWADFLGRLAPYGTRFDLMGIPFYRTEGACQWQSGPVSPKPTSVFDDFKPQQVPIIYVPTPKINKTQNIQLNEKYTVFDMQGRIIGVYTGKSLLNTRNITQKIVKGVYFIVNTKGHKAGKITLVK